MSAELQPYAENAPLCLAPLAPYACVQENTEGRIYDEPCSQTRTPFQRDRDRVLHSRAFRRLKHKTQVFVATEGDHYRTRLTHSLEVAQVARSLARSLWLNEDLAEVCALAHDLGHPPFAHAGEDALKECMEPYGGFDHNDQTLRIVYMLEKRYIEFDGLNLTWESLEGLAKHNEPAPPGEREVTLREISTKIDLKLDQYASLEAQVAGLSDDIAYNSHDMADGLRAGFFTVEDLTSIPLLAELVEEKEAQYPGADPTLIGYAVVRNLYARLVNDVLSETRARMQDLNPKAVSDIREAPRAMAAFSDEMEAQVTLLRAFLMERMYQHDKVLSSMAQSTDILRGLFTLFLDDPKKLPEDWQVKLKDGDLPRIVADYVAGMTDTYAVREHERLLK